MLYLTMITNGYMQYKKVNKEYGKYKTSNNWSFR